MIIIREALKIDALKISKLEPKSSTSAWGTDEYIRILKREDCYSVVMEENENIVGFMSIIKDDSVMQVIKITYNQDCNRILTAFLNHAITVSAKNERALMMVVRETNLKAQMHLKRMGFRATSILKGYFKGEDAIHFEWPNNVRQTKE